jgi:hypothetical protein
MESKPIKGSKLKTATNPETVISLEQDIIKFQIQINKLKNKILESQQKILILNKKGGFFDECEFKDFPDE